MSLTVENKDIELLERLASSHKKIKDEIAKVIVGQEEVVRPRHHPGLTEVLAPGEERAVGREGHLRYVFRIEHVVVGELPLVRYVLHRGHTRAPEFDLLLLRFLSAAGEDQGRSGTQKGQGQDDTEQGLFSTQH